MGLPRWHSSTESACQHRRYKRCRLNLWVTKIPWSRKWQPTPVFLPGKFHGQRLYSLWGHSRTWLSTHTHTHLYNIHDGYNIQFSSVAQSCLTLCDPMNPSTPGLPVHHHLLEFTQTHVHRVRDAIQPSHPRSTPSPAPSPSQHQSPFQWVNSSREVAKVLEFQR